MLHNLNNSQSNDKKQIKYNHLQIANTKDVGDLKHRQSQTDTENYQEAENQETK